MRRVLPALYLVLAAPALSSAQPARLTLGDVTVFRLNPLGLETRARFGVQKRLYAAQGAVARDNFAFVGAFPKLNPASANLGIGGELQPLSIFNVRAQLEVQQYFGTFGYLPSFASANANYSDHTVANLPGQTSRVLHAQLQPLVQLQVGPIAFVGQLQLDYWALAGVPAGDTLAYDATLDTLLPDQGWTAAADVDLMYVRPRFAIGAHFSHVHPFYTERHFVDAADRAAYDGNNMQSRLGVLAAYTLRDRGPPRFNKPTLILIASWYLQHRYRTGAPATLPAGGSLDDYTSRAVPYVLAGFAFESDFWVSSRPAAR